MPTSFGHNEPILMLEEMVVNLTPASPTLGRSVNPGVRMECELTVELSRSSGESPAMIRLSNDVLLSRLADPGFTCDPSQLEQIHELALAKLTRGEETETSRELIRQVLKLALKRIA